MTGADQIRELFESRGVESVWGLPGTQNAMLYCALSRSSIRCQTAIHELSAGFGALGYAATSSRTGVLALIGGPGFAYALTPILEARLDSIPIVCCVFATRPADNKQYGSQQIDHVALAEPACKRVFSSPHHDDVVPNLRNAFDLARQGEPGPVVVIIPTDYLSTTVSDTLAESSADVSLQSGMSDHTIESGIDGLVQRLNHPTSKLFLAGRGTLAVADPFRELVVRTGATVITTTSGRGVLPEDDAHVLRTDLSPTDVVNEFVATFDAVFAWGVKFSQNGAKGFELNIPAEKLTHIDRSGDVLHAGNYQAAHRLQVDLESLLPKLVGRVVATQRDPIALEAWRPRMSPAVARSERVRFADQTAENFFANLRRGLDDQAIVVVDSGFHQNMTRLFLTIDSPYGLLVPCGLQSMGFALPAAMGAAIANRDRPVYALLGDGGFQMCGTDLVNCVRDEIPLVAIVFDDGYYGLIRNQQLSRDGSECGVELHRIDYAAWAASIGCGYYLARDGIDGTVRSAARLARQTNSPVLIEVPVTDRLSTQLGRTKAKLAGIGRRIITRDSNR